MTDWSFDAWPAIEPLWHDGGRGRGTHADDQREFHVDLGCGKLKKARIGVDRFAADGVDVVLDLANDELPFDDSTIESIISHHALEHVADGFIELMDECYRVLKPGGIFRIIVPLFPSWSAVSDPDHKRYFMAHGESCTFDSFCGTPDNCWLDLFSVPYTQARFTRTHLDYTAPVPLDRAWTPDDAREMRVTLRAEK